jgi:23S rRNA (uridine2552-2'-O)-methyltransferase
MAKKTSKFSGQRQTKTRVKTARKRTISSTRWLERQLNDPYVHLAKKEGYRSRAAYKLAELDDKFKFLKPGKLVLDLGAAPGGWTQIAVSRVRSTEKDPRVIGVDILSMDPVAGAAFMQMDFMDGSAPYQIKRHLPPGLGKGFDVVLSDMAPNTTGHSATDHLRIMSLLEAAYAFCCEILSPGGTFVAKVFQGGTEKALLAQMKEDFTTVKHAKPKASRADSSEMYVVAMGFRKAAR